MKKRIVLYFLSLLLVLALTVPNHVSAEESNASAEISMVSDGVEYIYDDNGDIVEALIPVVYVPGMESRSATVGIWEFISGVCIVVELLSGYSCVSIVRYVGIEFINGVYMWKNKKYSGTVNADYQYVPGKVPGCTPSHSPQCNTGQWVLRVTKS